MCNHEQLGVDSGQLVSGWGTCHTHGSDWLPQTPRVFFCIACQEKLSFVEKQISKDQESCSRCLDMGGYCEPEGAQLLGWLNFLLLQTIVSHFSEGNLATIIVALSRWKTSGQEKTGLYLVSVGRFRGQDNFLCLEISSTASWWPGSSRGRTGADAKPSFSSTNALSALDKEFGGGQATEFP